MDTIEAILSRRIVPPAKMGPPGPDEASLRRILEAGAAAPDHGILRPWRFLVVRGTGRERLGDLFAAMADRIGASPAEMEKQRSAPLRAPVILVVVARLQPDHPKIPAVEQVASAAAAAQNMLLAAHALGFAAKWATGRQAHDRQVRQGLGLASDDRILGFLYLGSQVADHAVPPRSGLEGLVADWPGEA